MYFHCANHKLNLVIVDSVKGVMPVADFFVTLQFAYNFLCGSNVHSRWVDFQKKMGLKPIEFKRLSDTRWSAQVRAVAAVKLRFAEFVDFLRSIILNDENRERAGSAKSILSEINQAFLYIMLVMYDLLSETKKASDVLQDPKIDFVKASNYIEAIVEEIASYRNDAKASDYYQKSFEMAEGSDVPRCRESRRQSSLTDRFQDFVVYSTVGSRENPTTSDDMKRLILFPILDKLSCEFNERFNSSNMDIMRSLSALDPRSNNFLNVDEIRPFAEHYEIDMEGLSIEMRHAKRMVDRNEVRLNNILDRTS